jgi:hypothetical protein
MKAWLASLISRYLIADDPFPAHSQLDQMDNNK